MRYTPEDVKVYLDGIEINGFIDDAPQERLWYEDVKGKPFTVYATCQDWSVVEVPFNELGYEKNIKPMKPSLVSPFKVEIVKESLQN